MWHVGLTRIIFEGVTLTAHRFSGATVTVSPGEVTIGRRLDGMRWTRMRYAMWAGPWCAGYYDAPEAADRFVQLAGHRPAWWALVRAGRTDALRDGVNDPTFDDEWRAAVALLQRRMLRTWIEPCEVWAALDRKSGDCALVVDGREVLAGDAYAVGRAYLDVVGGWRAPRAFPALPDQT